MDSTSHIMPPTGPTLDFYERYDGTWEDADGKPVDPRTVSKENAGDLTLTFLTGEDFDETTIYEVAMARKYNNIGDLIDAVEAKRRELGL